jgi:hypothetical protein
MRRSKAALPLVAGARGPHDVERERHVGARLAGALAHDQLPHRGALSPVDVARVLAFAHQLQAEEVLAVAAADDESPPGDGPRRGGSCTGSTAG